MPEPIIMTSADSFIEIMHLDFIPKFLNALKYIDLN